MNQYLAGCPNVRDEPRLRPLKQVYLQLIFCNLLDGNRFERHAGVGSIDLLGPYHRTKGMHSGYL